MKPTQNDIVLRMLTEMPEGITQLDALRPIRDGGAGCFRLAARIADLRAAGHDIHSEMVTTDSGKRVARYTLVTPTLWGVA